MSFLTSQWQCYVQNLRDALNGHLTLLDISDHDQRIVCNCRPASPRQHFTPQMCPKSSLRNWARPLLVMTKTRIETVEVIILWFSILLLDRLYLVSLFDMYRSIRVDQSVSLSTVHRFLCLRSSYAHIVSSAILPSPSLVMYVLNGVADYNLALACNLDVFKLFHSTYR